MNLNKKLKQITELAYRYGKYDMGLEKFYSCPDFEEFNNTMKEIQDEIDKISGILGLTYALGYNAGNNNNNDLI